MNLGHSSSVLKLHLGGRFLWWVWSTLSHVFCLLVIENLFSRILECLLKLVFFSPFAWKNFFQPLYSEVMSIFFFFFFFLRQVFMQPKNGSCFSIQCVNRFLFISELRPLMLRGINDQWLLVPVILLVVVVLSVCVCVCVYVCLSSFGFTVWWLFSCVFLGIITFFVLEFTL